jgi:hypothetical protein
MGYLILLVGLTVLHCQRNCNILNRFKIDNVVIVKAMQKLVRWSETNGHHNVDTVCNMHLVHFIVSVQQIHNIFILNYLFLTTLLHV